MASVYGKPTVDGLPTGKQRVDGKFITKGAIISQTEKSIKGLKR